MRWPRLLLPPLILLLASGSAFAAGPWGEYPDCVAPAVPLEVQSWWWESGEPIPRHLHHAACVPNARTAACDPARDPIVSQPTTFTSRVIAYNNPDEISIIRWSWQGDVEQVVDVDWRCTPGSGSRIGSHDLEQCIWREEMTLDPRTSHGGLDELRLTPNIPENEFGKRQFATLNFQVCTPGDGAYRSAPDPIGRSWYEDFSYSNVRVNYMDFFDGLDQTIPRVSGVVPLEVDHQKGSGETRSRLWLDMNHHEFPDVFGNPPPVGEAHPSGGLLLYDEPGLFDGLYLWDTTVLADGVHTLFFQTLSSTDEGTNVAGLKLLFEVDNGGPVDGPLSPPDPPVLLDGRPAPIR